MAKTDPRTAKRRDLEKVLAELAATGQRYRVFPEGTTGRGRGQLAARILPSGVILWCFRYQHAGTRAQVSLGRCDPAGAEGLDYYDAIAESRRLSGLLQGPAAGDLLSYLAAEKRKRAEQLDKERARQHRRDKTLRKLLETYVEWLVAQGKQRSAYDTRNLLENHLLGPWPDLAKSPAADVTRAAIADVVRKVVTQGKERTAGKLRSMIAAAYECAIKVGDDASIDAAFKDFGIDQNPARSVKLKGAGIRARKVRMPLRVISRLLILLRAERGVAASALRILIDLGGQRQQQLLRVARRDVNLSERTLLQYDPKGNRSEPREHELPLVGRTVRQVANVLQRIAQRESEWLFTTDLVHHLRDETVRELFRKLAAAAGTLEEERVERTWRLSDVRRTVESELGERNYTREQRGWLLSHGFSGVQARHYECIQARGKIAEMLTEWQRVLRTAERKEWRDILGRAASGSEPHRVFLHHLAQRRQGEAAAGWAVPAAAVPSPNVTALKVVHRAELADPLLTPVDLQELFHVGASTLKRIRDEESFPEPSLRIGRSPRWRQSAIEQYLQSQERKRA